MQAEEHKYHLENTSLDRSLERIFLYLFKNKTTAILIVIFILGVFLRYLAVMNIEPNADEMVHGAHAVGIIESGIIGRIWQSILWSYLTDFFYSLFGQGILGARSLSFIFGSLTIPLLYLIGKEEFNERVGIIASFFLAISPFTIIYTIIEMDISAIFFVLLALLFFIKRLKKDDRLSLLAALFIGIAALIKTLALFFVPAFIIGYCLHNRRFITKKILLDIFLFGGILLLLFSPIIIHNWLWYQEDRMVDAYFAQFFDFAKSRGAYQGIAGINDGFRFNDAIFGAYNIILALIQKDPLITLLGILSMAFFIRKREKNSLFFACFQIFPFILIDLTNRLGTHYIVLLPVLAIYAGAFIDKIAEKYSNKIEPGKIFIFVIFVAIFLSFYILFPYLTSQSAVPQMRSYAQEHISKNDIVVADARIYRGRIMWMFIDKHYLESSYLPKILEVNEMNDSKITFPYKIFFVECIPDDCGWGTIKDQHEFNESMESIVNLFKQNAHEEIVITSGGTKEFPANTPYFRVYSTTIQLKPELIAAIDSTHSFFYYPAYYMPKGEVFDAYEVRGMFNSLLFLCAKLIIWVSFIISLVSIFLIAFLIGKEIKNREMLK
jgi:hypothetical protein